MEKNIYVVVSQSGTLTSKLVSKCTHSKFCHVSISLDEGLHTMYSFGRRHKYTPWFGGYVKESPDTGIVKKFLNKEIAVLRFSVEEDRFAKVQAYLEDMYRNRKVYKYNYLGAFLSVFHKNYQKKNKFYCSQFVRDVLLKFNVCQEEDMPKGVIFPRDFLSAFAEKIIYRGRFTTLL